MKNKIQANIHFDSILILKYYSRCMQKGQKGQYKTLFALKFKLNSNLMDQTFSNWNVPRMKIVSIVVNPSHLSLKNQ